MHASISNSDRFLCARSARWRRALPLWLLLGAIVGCGGSSGPAREAVYGTVKREGQPIDRGNIKFTSDVGGVVVATRIVDGKYRFTRNTGPVPGKTKVEIIQDPLREQRADKQPKKDAKVVKDERFKKPMPKGGWVKDVDVAKGHSKSIDFDLE